LSKTFPVLAGVSRIDITPPVGVDLSGYAARENPSLGIHDPIFAKCLALDAGPSRLAVVCADLVGLSPQSVANIRRTVEDETGITSDNLLLTCTHTHSGPATVQLRECGDPDLEYVAKLEQEIARSVSDACGCLQPARLGFGRGEAKTSFNRRRPGEGPVDDEVTVLRVDTEGGEPLATWINATCHAVVLTHENLLVSADFPGAVTRFVEQEIGGVALFSNGACGDINPKHGDFDYVESVGKTMASEAIRVRENIETSAETSIAVDSETFPIFMADTPQIDDARREVEARSKELEEAEKVGGCQLRVARACLDAAKGAHDLALNEKTLKPLEADLKLVSIANHFFVSFPGEVLVTVGLKIKETLPGQIAFLGYSDGCLGYIPMKEDFEAGGYEPASAWIFYGYDRPFAPGVGELLIEKANELIKRRIDKCRS